MNRKLNEKNIIVITVQIKPILAAAIFSRCGLILVAIIAF